MGAFRGQTLLWANSHGRRRSFKQVCQRLLTSIQGLWCMLDSHYLQHLQTHAVSHQVAGGFGAGPCNGLCAHPNGTWCSNAGIKNPEVSLAKRVIWWKWALDQCRTWLTFVSPQASVSLSPSQASYDEAHACEQTSLTVSASVFGPISPRTSMPSAFMLGSTWFRFGTPELSGTAVADLNSVDFFSQVWSLLAPQLVYEVNGLLFLITFLFSLDFHSIASLHLGNLWTIVHAGQHA